MAPGAADGRAAADLLRGYRAVSGIVDDLRVLHPDWTDRQVHDLVLSHGSPAPRHLRTLLGI